MITSPSAYTIWCKGGRIGTYRSRERAEEVMREIADHPERYLHIQEWEPGSHYPYVTFDDDTDAEK